MKHRALLVALAALLVTPGCVGYRTKLAAEAQREGKLERSFNLYRSLARQGNAEAQYQVGQHYAVGQGVERNETKAMRFYRKAAEKGVLEAREKLALMYLHGSGNPEEDLNAERWLNETAENAEADTQYKLATLYLDGEIVPQDKQKGLHWLRKAADSWKLVSRGIDDRLFDEGRLIEAAELGLPDAQLGLGKRFAAGKGLPLNNAEAVKWYYYAAEQGHADSQLTLGWAYGKGEGVPKDFEEAVRWFRKAAEQAMPEAEYQLGAAYRRGTGVAQDNVTAYMWFNIAAGHGLRKARTKRRETAMDMTPEELVRAQALALEHWRAEQARAGQEAKEQKD